VVDLSTDASMGPFLQLVGNYFSIVFLLL